VVECGARRPDFRCIVTRAGPGLGHGSSYNCYQEIARALHLEGAANAV
jgi:hypothetical protein